MYNALENWKQECYFLSSSLAIRKQLERTDVDRIYKIFKDYFGLKYFDRESPEIAIDSEPNWLVSLFVNHQRPACIAALSETANIILYLQTLRPSIQKKFKSLLQDPNQFRSMFFELYVYRLLDYNGIKNEKKSKEGQKEIEGTCIIGRREFLFECRKIYSPDIHFLNASVYALEKSILKLSSLNKGFGLIGTFRFKNLDGQKAKEIFNAKFNRFLKGFTEQTFRNIDYHDHDEDGELSVVDYTEANNLEVEKDSQSYHVIFKIIPPFNIVPGIPNHYRVELRSNFSAAQKKITQKLFNALADKQKQHADSKYHHKIYFIDSESTPDFALPIFGTEAMLERERIIQFLEAFSENEIVCFIRREYMDYVPKVSIQAFGKNIDVKVKERLESLKTNFDYQIGTDRRSPSRFNLFYTD